MARTTGTYERTTIAGESVAAFIPHPLPPTDPPLDLGGALAPLLARAEESVRLLELAGEAPVDADVEEVCGYVEALNFAWDELGRADGLPLSMRLLSSTHALLLRGARGAQKQPGEVRRTQNWIGGTRPGNAAFVPPPPHRDAACRRPLRMSRRANLGSQKIIDGELMSYSACTLRRYPPSGLRERTARDSLDEETGDLEPVAFIRDGGEVAESRLHSRPLLWTHV
jgi:hypothetical protein